MKQIKPTIAACMMALLFAGCSGSSKAPTASCSSDLSYAKTDITFSAPSKDEAVDTLTMKMTLYPSFFGLDAITEDMMNQADDTKALLSSSLSIPESDIELDITSESVVATITATGSAIDALMGLAQDANINVEEMKTQVESLGYACD